MAVNTILGRLSSVKLGTDTILQLGSWSLTIEGTPVEKAFFLETWMQIHGIASLKWSASLEGSLHKTDATGQNLLRSAATLATEIDNIKFYLDDTSYWASKTNYTAYVLSYGETVERGDLVNISISVGGSGEIEYNAA